MSRRSAACCAREPPAPGRCCRLGRRGDPWVRSPATLAGRHRSGSPGARSGRAARRGPTPVVIRSMRTARSSTRSRVGIGLAPEDADGVGQLAEHRAELDECRIRRLRRRSAALGGAIAAAGIQPRPAAGRRAAPRARSAGRARLLGVRSSSTASTRSEDRLAHWLACEHADDTRRTRLPSAAISTRIDTQQSREEPERLQSAERPDQGVRQYRLSPSVSNRVDEQC